MISLTKKIIYSVVFLFVLSINIGQKPIFSYIYPVTSALMGPVQGILSSTATRVYRHTKIVTKKMFNNATPRSAKDQVNSRSSGIRKEQDQIYDYEREELKKLLK